MAFMAFQALKRKFSRVEEDEDVYLSESEAVEHPERRRRTPMASGNSDNTFLMPGKSILRPERSSHISAPSEVTSGPLLLAPSVRTNRPRAYPASGPSTTALASFNDPTSDEEDDGTMDGVVRSLDESEHARRMAEITLKERGDRYKQRYHSSKQQISNLRLEKAEALRQMDERAASAAMSTERKTIEGLTKAKDKAEARWKCYKGQLKEAVKQINNLNNQVAYLETLLRFEERSGYSSKLSGLQLE